MIDSQLTLFEGTIEDNIVLGRSCILYSDVRWALRFTELKDDDALPKESRPTSELPGQSLPRLISCGSCSHALFWPVRKF